jgi:hypothetical protein
MALGLGLSGSAYGQYVNPNTGINWNNPVSSSIDTTLYWQRQRAMMEASLASQQALAAEKLRRERILQGGKEKAKRGQATTRFDARPFQVESWLKVWKPKTPAERQQLVDECRIQGEIWDREAKARGANLQDIGDTAALAFVLAFEVLSGGQKASAKAYQSLVQSFRDNYLKDYYFQGLPDADKQSMQDGIFLNATDPVRRWQRSKTENDPAELTQARKEARDHLSRFWTGPVDKLQATPDRFTSLP